jgi:hypothetical protein
MRTYTIDTNAGPILQREFRTAADARTYVERSVPLLRKRGYTAEWARSGKWHVCNVLNSKGRQVHACAFRPGTLRGA